MYKEKIVCFIDILGFGDMVEHEFLKEPDKIYGILSEIRTSVVDWVGAPITSRIDLQITQFSDSIVFSFLSKAHYFMTFNFLKELSIKMVMKYGVIFRGGITFGQIYHDTETLFGPAMNRAYRLESKEAIYPRIVIDKAALDLTNDQGKKISDYPGQFVFRLTNSGYSYIDYITDVKNYIDQPVYYDKLKEIINKGFLLAADSQLSPEESERLKAKYEWMRNEYNNAKQNYSELVIIE